MTPLVSARTCHFFLVIASAVLWTRLTKILPFLTASKKQAGDKAFKSLRAWSSVSTRLSLQGVRTESGILCHPDAHAAECLEQHWQGAGTRQGVEGDSARQFLKFAPLILAGIVWIINLEAIISTIMFRCDCPCGPDGYFVFLLGLW